MKKINIIIPVIAIITWVCLTITNKHLLFYWGDEFHAWNIASNFGFVDIIRLMRSEGHTFIWYMLLKPFTYFNYVHGMTIINWTSVFLSICILWKYAPFDKFTKILITFSCPLLSIYPIIARCYGIGILCLFALTALYQKRKEHPYWYATLVFLASNTSLVAAIPALVLGGMFGIELLKEKNYKPIIILLSTLLMLYIQWHNPLILSEHNLYLSYQNRFNILKSIFSKAYTFKALGYISMLVLPISFLAFLIQIRKNIPAFIFAIVSISALFYILTFIYIGVEYHFYFIFICIIIAAWINLNQNSNNTRKFIAFTIICLCICLRQTTCNHCFRYNNWYEDISNWIKQEVSVNDKIFLQLCYHSELITYLKGYNLRSYNDEKINSFKNYQEAFFKHKFLNAKDFIPKAPENSYLLFNAWEVNNKKILNLDLKDHSKYKHYKRYFLYKLR